MDAALDATNVARVAHYIRSRTRGAQQQQEGGGGGGDKGGWEGAMAPFQSIVISLKDNFYEKVRAFVCCASCMACARGRGQ